MIISSRANERVKALRTLKNRRDRDATGAFFIEGTRLLDAALAYGAQIELVVVAPDRLRADEERLVDTLAERRLPMLEVTPDIFDSVSFREESQSVAAVVNQRWETLSDTTVGKRAWVMLHDIQHPGNLGTVIRNNDAIGGDGVILSGQSTDPYHPVAVRGTLGAIFSQRIVRTTPVDFAQWLQKGDYTVIGTTPDGDRDYRQVDYTSKPVVLIMGNERIGISEDQKALCDALVRIPMAGYVESLNLSIAAALVQYEILRQREPLP